MLALDIGNTSIKYGLFREGRRIDGGRLPAEAEFTSLPRAEDEEVAAVAVAPERLARVRDAFPRLRVIGEDVSVPVEVHYDPPEACGRDRVMAVVGAMHRVEGEVGVLVLEAGTCLTATVGSRERGVLGGAILPGYALMLSSLADGTAALPRLEPVPPGGDSIGRSTAASIRSGCWAAQVGAARELIARFRAECDFDFRVVAAGTGAGALAGAVGEIDLVHPFATLWGVYLSATRG